MSTINVQGDGAMHHRPILSILMPRRFCFCNLFSAKSLEMKKNERIIIIEEAALTQVALIWSFVHSLLRASGELIAKPAFTNVDIKRHPKSIHQH
jgi:hypothetical protein